MRPMACGLSVLVIAFMEEMGFFDSKEAAQVLGPTIGGNEMIDSDLLECLRSEAAADCISKDDMKTLGKLLASAKDERAESKKFRDVVKREGYGGGGQNAEAVPGAGPPEFPGDRAMTLEEVQALAPPKTYVYRDSVWKRWQLFWSERDITGYRWSVSSSWGPTGDELMATRSALRRIWGHCASLTGLRSPIRKC